jgi:biotin carboxyl carrier protein
MTQEYQVQVSTGPSKVVKDCLVEVEPLAAEGVPASASLAGGTRFQVRLEGRCYVLEARRAEERGAVVSWTLVDESGIQRVIDIDGTPPDLKISVSGGDALSVRVNDRRDLLAQTGSAAGGAAASGDLRAAMPGKVVKVLCKVGDVVKAGQGLLVIEAMKMENEVRAATAGKVAAVSVREGQTVEGGQALVSVSSE